MTRAIADTSVFIAREAGRPLEELPDEIAVSVVTAAELELGVLRAQEAGTGRARSDALARARRVPPAGDRRFVASCFARIADGQLSAGRRLRRDDTWIAATALRHRVAVVTQDADFTDFTLVDVIRV